MIFGDHLQTTPYLPIHSSEEEFVSTTNPPRVHQGHQTLVQRKLTDVMSEVVQLGMVVLSMVVEVVEEPLSLILLHEITVRLKRNMEKLMSICFIWFPIGVLG